MPLYQTVLCAVDFSDNSRYALKLGLRIARHCRARVIAFHAIDLLLAEAAASAYNERQLRADAESELRAFAAAAADGGEPPEIVVQVGVPGRVILDSARERAVDLIVMGTEGLGGIRKALFGSVTENVLRGNLVPVLAVKPPGTDAAGAPTGLVAAVDFDDAAPIVLEHAEAFAAEFGVPLTLLHVVAAVQALPQYTDALAAAQADRVERAKGRLQEEAARLTKGAAVRTDVRTGRAAEEIAAVMRESPGAFLAIAVCGGRLLHRPGSTAYRVLSLTSTPVLAIPS
jgi:nucleotide-binding universal stress UspA family protein